MNWKEMSALMLSEKDIGRKIRIKNHGNPVVNKSVVINHIRHSTRGGISGILFVSTEMHTNKEFRWWTPVP